MFFIPTVACYMTAQDAYQKYLGLMTTMTNIAVAATTMSIVTPLLLTPKK